MPQSNSYFDKPMRNKQVRFHINLNIDLVGWARFSCPRGRTYLADLTTRALTICTAPLFRATTIIKNTSQIFVLLTVASLLGWSSSTIAASPTSAQMQMFQKLSPQQQQEAIKAFQSGKVPGAGGGVISPSFNQATPQSFAGEPELVTPKPVEATANSDAIVKSAQSATDAPTLTEEKETKVVPKKLEQFGYDLFSGTPTTFAPATDIPMPTSFIVGPGDTVQVQLFGKENAEYDLVVSREGQLRFPGIGPISVAGLRFDELKKTLSARIKRQMIGVKANVTMGNLRSIRVFVLGDVIRPGSYTVSALSTMTNALFVSGGVTPIGSLRNIQLKRSGEIISSIDLYDLLLRGDTSKDTRLQPGDVIFVPPIGKTVGVAGEVKRPAIYELNIEKTVNEALDFAGGMLPTAYPKATQLERITNKGDKTLLDIDTTNPEKLALAVQDGDVIRVYSALEKMQNIVLLSGHVQRPGGAQWFEGMRLTDLISSVDALLPKPDLNYVVIKRETLPERYIEVVTTRLDQALADPASNYNIMLKSRDEVMFFGLGENRTDSIKSLMAQLKQQERYDEPAKIVTIRGNVHYPGEYPYSKQMRLTDIIRAAYDVQPQTDMDYAVIARRIDNQGEIKAFSVSLIKALQDPLSEKNTPLQEKDTVYIFSASEYKDEEKVALNRQELLKPLFEKLHQQTKSGELPQVISISGLVVAPGQYLLDKDMQIKDLITAAGGLTESAYTHSAELSRYKIVDGEYREVNHYTISQAQLFDTSVAGDLELQPYDHLNIKRIPLWTEQQTIELKGELKFPGVYTFRRGETLSAVLKRAGGLTKFAFPEGALFMREELQRREQQELDKLATRLESDITASALESSQSVTVEKIPDANATGFARSLLKQLRETKAAGRLVIDVNEIIRISQTSQFSDDEDIENSRDIVLKSGDILYVPQHTQEVTILGEVQQSTSHMYNENLSRDDYINLSGGTTYKADDDRIYIVRANGAVVSEENTSWYNSSGTVKPGDTIVVPIDTDRMKPLTFWTSISQIVYQLGIAAAAWNTVGIF